jgi:HPt (histidine-containing phosphotransfer) domain-containing protein
METRAIPAHDNTRPQPVWTLPEELQQLAQDGGADVVADVIAVYQQDSAARLEVLRAAVRNKDCKAIRAEGHSLKGSSSQLGAAEMAGMCFQMEQMGQSGDIGDAESLLAQIEKHFVELNQAMSNVNWGDVTYGG